MRRPLLLPLALLYGAVIAVKRLLQGKPRQLAAPVISVGSLSAGGAGKTPVVAALASLLMRNSYAVDVLSRGYGRRSSAIERVDPAGTAERFGDEPLELARETGAAVYVGADRYAAGLLAERDAGLEVQPLVHLLDDGFQHRRLARDLDVVLLTQEDAADWLLPAGNLREPLHRLAEAGAVVLREEEEAELRPAVTRLATGVPVWVIRRRLDVAAVTIRRPLAFCGIARPKGFFSLLRQEGVVLAETVAFRDHHAYGERDVERLLEAERRSGADGFVTTAKDAVKLAGLLQRKLEAAGPLAVARLTVSLVDEEGALADIAAAMRVRRVTL